jgi:mono/diheme cytochrome c family protein
MRWRRVRLYLTIISAATLAQACGAGDLGDSTVERCVPEGACDPSMFKGGISAALGSAERGRSLFERECVRCHGADGLGLAEARHIDMTSPAWQASLRDPTLVKIVRSGRPPLMPAFSFGDDELRDLLAHIRSLEARSGGTAKGGY